MARMPVAWANCKPKIETPPVPCSSTVSPALSLACSIMACQAVTPAQGSVAPSSKERFAGIFTTPSSSSSAYSASMPSMPPPSALAWTSGADFAAGPALKKIAGDAVAGLDSGDAGANFDHLAGAVRQRNDLLPHWHAIAAADDAEIAEIERAGAYFDQYLAMAGLWRIGPLDSRQRIRFRRRSSAIHRLSCRALPT